jgi:hypothetical protein
MDGLPIDSSQPQVRVEWNHTVLRAMFHSALLTRVGGSGNVFVAAIPIDMRSEPGEYRLRVLVVDGWDDRGQVCEFALLNQTFVLESPNGLNTMWLSVGSLSACAVFVGAIVVWARRMKAELRDLLVMVLTETSKTVVSISFELGDLATDLLTTYRVVFEAIVRSPQYRVPYAVFGCLSIMAALISLAYHVHRARELRAQIKTNAKIQSHAAEADEYLHDNEDNEDDAHKAVVRKLAWELEKTSRDLQGLAVGMLCFFLEGLPMVRVRRPAPRR